jgi:hypothetical protein
VDGGANMSNGAVQIPDKPIQDMTDKMLTLIHGLSKENPRLHEALTYLTQQVQDITDILNPVRETVIAQIFIPGTLIPPDNLNYTLTPTTIRLTWDRPKISGTLIYEIRKSFGPDKVNWDEAEFVTRTQLTLVDLVPTAGLFAIYYVKTSDILGNYSIEAAVIDIIVLAPSTVNLSTQVIDNNVLLRWTVPVSSFQIAFYEIKRDTTLIGQVSGTFTTVFETVAGEYTYSVTAVDILGNRGMASSATVQVNQPPDYVLTDSRLSTFQGTQVRILVYTDPTLAAA